MSMRRQCYQQLGGLFKDYPAKSLQAGLHSGGAAAARAAREVHQEFATELTRLSLAWHIPEITHPDVPALDLLSTILGDGRSSRLYRRVREEAGWPSASPRFPTRRAIRDCSGSMRPLSRRNVKPAQDLILKIVDEIKAAGVTAEELAKAKKISLSHHLGSLTTMRGQASDLGSNWFLTRNLNFTRDYLAAVQKMTRGRSSVASRAKYLTSDNLTIVSLNPKGALAARTTEADSRSSRERSKRSSCPMDCVSWCAKIRGCRWSR